MSNIDLSGITASLDKYKLDSWDTPSSFLSQISTPNLTFPSNDNGFLSGISLSKETVSEPLQYKDDIFSELPIKVFDKTYNAQMAETMSAFRKMFRRIIANNKVEKIIPKLEYYYNEEDLSELFRMTSQWDEGDAMMYLSFEKDPLESNFGLLWNDDKQQNYETRSGNLYLSKADDVIHEIIDFILRVYNV